jgi:hypothetical protein
MSAGCNSCNKSASTYVSRRQKTSAYVSIRQHQHTSAARCPQAATVATRAQANTSADVSRRQHTSAYVSIRQHTSAARCPQAATVATRAQAHTSADVSRRQQTSADVSIRQHTSAYVSIRQQRDVRRLQEARKRAPRRFVCQYLYFCTSNVNTYTHTRPGAFCVSICTFVLVM